MWILGLKRYKERLDYFEGTIATKYTERGSNNSASETDGEELEREEAGDKRGRREEQGVWAGQLIVYKATPRFFASID